MALWHAHDLSYKLLFSHQRMMSDLLLDYAPGKWAEAIDLSALQRVHSAFVSDDLRSRCNDVVWRAHWKENGRPVYILVEFQSWVNRFMGLKTAVYSGMLCQDLVRARRLTPDSRLPSIVVLVLYNGRRP